MEYLEVVIRRFFRRPRFLFLHFFRANIANLYDIAMGYWTRKFSARNTHPDMTLTRLRSSAYSCALGPVAESNTISRGISLEAHSTCMKYVHECIGSCVRKRI